MTTASYDDGTPVPAYWTPVRSAEQLAEAGFKDVHDVIVRILKEDLAALEIGKNIELFDPDSVLMDTVRIAEYGRDFSINPEWVIGCKNIY